MNQERRAEAQIRMAETDDAFAIASVLQRSFVEYESAYTPEAFAATISSPNLIIDRLSEGPIWVAELNDVIIGTVSALPTENALYIRGMAVDPIAQGKKIGYKLLMCVEGFASRNGLKSMFLSTTPFLVRAIRLYEQCGFRRSEEGSDNLFQTPLFTMVKSLS